MAFDPHCFDPAPFTALCHEAGALLMAWRADAHAQSEVPGRPGKLHADMALHQLLCGGLARLEPATPVISEEDLVHEDTRPPRYWLIDPIDGTASWRGGFPGFVVQMALIVGGTPVVGIVHAPALNQDWLGLRGAGAWRDGKRLLRLSASPRCVIVDNYPQPRRAAAPLMDALPGASYLESGSLGLKCCFVADGTADLFVKDVVVRDWDIAPAAVLLAETGAALESYAGGAYAFSGNIEKPQGVIAARDGALAQAARAALAAGVSP